jgi:DNA mismatch repair protein MutS2
MKIRTTLDRLMHATQVEIKQHLSNIQLAGRGHSVTGELNAKMAEFKMSIDIRSKKPEEAKEVIARYIDQAILLRVHEVRILHGKGNGVLRTLVHNYLNDTPEVAKFEDEKLERGGHGVTLVYFH